MAETWCGLRSHVYQGLEFLAATAAQEAHLSVRLTSFPYIGKSQNIKRSEYSHSRIKAIANWAVNRAANFTIDTDIEAEENSES